MTGKIVFCKMLGIRHLEKPIKKVENSLLIFTTPLKISTVAC
jgi:hypothetical protein